jgi:hypothetical protein
MRWLLLLLVLCCISSASAVVINEIMPNPTDNCYDCTEWIELYAAESTNLTGWILDAGGENNTLSTTIDDYVVFTKNKTAFLELWPISADKVVEISASLRNSNDNVSLYDGNSLVDEHGWLSDPGNKSLARVPNGAGDFTVCGIPTPGSLNDCTADGEEETEEEQYDLKLEVKIQNATQNTNAKNLFKLTNLDYKTNQPYMNVTVEFTVKLNNNLEYEDSFTVEFKQSKSTGTGEWTPQSFGTYELCGKITESSFKDPDEDNNDVCEDIIVYENKTIVEEVQENNNITADENRTLGISLRNSTANASAEGDYVTGAYTWRSGSTSIGVAFWLFTAVLLIFVIVLLLTLLRRR